MDDKFLKWDPKSKNIISMALWALIQSWQLLIIVALIFSFIPFKAHPFAEKLFLLHRNGVQPEREMFFYRMFVVAAVLFLGAALYLFRRRLDEGALTKKILSLTAVDAGWIFIQVFTIFKIFVTDDPEWARYVLYAAMAGAVVTRVFWTEIKEWAPRVYQKLLDGPAVRTLRLALDIAVPAYIILIIYVPDLTKVLARIFVRDQFYHLDSFIMAPGWAQFNGLVLNRDVISEYSVLIPFLVSRMAKVFGGFDYQHVIAVLMVISILYFIGFYFFLRNWLRSSLIAAFGALLAVKLQMFHWGVSPIIWQFPSATVVRYLFDLPVLWLLWRHCRTGEMKNLLIAAVLCGISLAYMIDTGIYLCFVFVIYVLVYPILSDQGSGIPNKWKAAVPVLFLPIVSALIVLFMFQGPVIFSATYWKNTLEFSGLFLKGWGALPMYDGLKERQFFAFIMGFIIPVFYVLSMILTATLTLLRQIQRKNIFAAILCLYGLGLFHYFVNRSAVSSYYVVCIPLVAMVCYWIEKFVRSISEARATVVKIILVVAMTGALSSSYLVTFYPNIFNLAGNKPWKDEVQFYKQEFELKRDVALIDQLTSKDQKVALISSFEIKLLMDAQRKPFFYYFPLIESTHMRLAHFRGTYLHTQGRLRKTLDQLTEQKPEYVFIEQKLFKRLLPAQYYQAHEALEALLKYLDTNYQPVQEGQYLVALKHR